MASVLVERIMKRARTVSRRVVLPEATDERVLRAARRITDERLARVALVGDPDRIRDAAKALGVTTGGTSGVSLDGIEVVDPLTDPLRERYVKQYWQLRAHKGVDEAAAQQQLRDPLNWAAMMARNGEADALVAGASSETAALLRATFTIIGTPTPQTTISSCFLIETPARNFGVDGAFIFADCAVLPDPTAEQLAEIAVAAADAAHRLFAAEPVVALLSFSTKGSATHPEAEKMARAAQLAAKIRPSLQVDGELQADAALVEEIGRRKAPNSGIAGRANVLIFPNLAAANIAYKLVQRLAGGDAYGPLLLGSTVPVSDLSRGCTTEEIVITTALTLGTLGER